MALFESINFRLSPLHHVGDGICKKPSRSGGVTQLATSFEIVPGNLDTAFNKNPITHAGKRFSAESVPHGTSPVFLLPPMLCGLLRKNSRLPKCRFGILVNRDLDCLDVRIATLAGLRLYRTG